MSTHAVTIVYNEENKPICKIYRHADGYPKGHGKELAEFLAPIKVINGAGPDGTANGMECLAAQIVAHFKDRPGEIYLFPPSSKPEYDYLYRVTRLGNTTYLKVQPYGRKVFYEGTPDRVLAHIKSST